MPIVSVIIPAYNQGHYLAKAVQSVLDQSFADLEVIIVDDGSTDDTRQVARSFSDPRVRYIHQSNAGLSAARNTGIRHATGKFLSFLDSDDLFLPHKLEILLAKFNAEPSLGFVAGQAVLIDENDTRIGEIFDKALPEDGAQLLLGNPLHVGSMLVRHEWQTRVGYFDENLRSYEDWDMWLRLAKIDCLMGWVAKPVSLYRFHSHQMTRNGAQMTTATFAVLEKLFSQSDVPPRWQTMRDKAYSHAHLRGAAQAYQAETFKLAADHMEKAVQLNPNLLDNHAQTLANYVIGWANYAKTKEPLAYLENIYAHLPKNLSVLQKRRNRDLATEAIQLAFEAQSKNDAVAAKTAVVRAFFYQPKWLFNRGALSVFVKSWWRTLKFRPTTEAKIL